MLFTPAITAHTGQGNFHTQVWYPSSKPTRIHSSIHHIQLPLAEVLPSQLGVMIERISHGNGVGAFGLCTCLLGQMTMNPTTMTLFTCPRQTLARLAKHPHRVV